MVGDNIGDKSDVEQVCESDSKNNVSRSQSSESDSNSQSPKTNKANEKHEKSKENSTDQNDTSSKKCEVKETKTNEVPMEHLVCDVEDGECSESEDEPSKTPKADELESDDQKVEQVPEELEEGEIIDDEDTLEKIEPIRIVCKFFLRGHCSWGNNCKFLHPANIDNESCNMLESTGSVMYDVIRPHQVETVWERGLRTAKQAMYKSLKDKRNFENEESDHENASTSEIMYTRHPPTRYYSPEEHHYKKRQKLEYSKSRSRERSSSYYDQPCEDKDVYYKTKRSKREVSASKEAWSDPWMRSKSAAGSKRRNYSFSSYSSSSYSSSTSRSSHGSHKKRSRWNREKRSSPHSRIEIKERPVSRRARRDGSLDEFGRSIKKTDDEGAIRGEVRKRSIKSVSSSSLSSDSSDSSSSKFRRNKRKRSDVDLKNEKVSKNRLQSSADLESSNADTKKSKRKLLLKKLKEIDSAIASHPKNFKNKNMIRGKGT